MPETWRAVAALACAALAMGGAADAARAGTATGRPAQFTAAAGETNAVTVDAGPGGTAQFSDAGAPIGLGLWCLPIPLGQAQCDPDGDPRDTDGGGVTVDLGDGNDRATVLGVPGTAVDPGSIRVLGGSGDDDLESSATAFLRFEGGDGDDRLVVGPNTTAVLLGGAGADVMMSSATCCVTASYEDHGTAGVHVTLDGKANDGVADEGDDVQTSTVLGSPGPDVITGGPGADHLTGSGGADRLAGGGGDDSIDATVADAGADAGPDGVDRVSCGAGTDVVTADPNDRVAVDCETIHVGTPPAPELALDPGAARASRTGTLAMTYRVRFPEAGSAVASRNAVRLVDAGGRTASTSAGFVLGGAANVARVRVRLTASTRRRLARARSGRLRLFAHRVSRDVDSATAPSNYATYNTPLTVRRTPRR